MKKLTNPAVNVKEIIESIFTEFEGSKVKEEYKIIGFSKEVKVISVISLGVEILTVEPLFGGFYSLIFNQVREGYLLKVVNNTDLSVVVKNYEFPKDMYQHVSKKAMKELYEKQLIDEECYEKSKLLRNNEANSIEVFSEKEVVKAMYEITKNKLQIKVTKALWEEAMVEFGIELYRTYSNIRNIELVGVIRNYSGEVKKEIFTDEDIYLVCSNEKIEVYPDLKSMVLDHDLLSGELIFGIGGVEEIQKEALGLNVVWDSRLKNISGVERFISELVMRECIGKKCIGNVYSVEELTMSEVVIQYEEVAVLKMYEKSGELCIDILDNKMNHVIVLEYLSVYYDVVKVKNATESDLDKYTKEKLHRLGYNKAEFEEWFRKDVEKMDVQDYFKNNFFLEKMVHKVELLLKPIAESFGLDVDKFELLDSIMELSNSEQNILNGLNSELMDFELIKNTLGNIKGVKMTTNYEEVVKVENGRVVSVSE